MWFSPSINCLSDHSKYDFRLEILKVTKTYQKISKSIQKYTKVYKISFKFFRRQFWSPTRKHLEDKRCIVSYLQRKMNNTFKMTEIYFFNDNVLLIRNLEMLWLSFFRPIYVVIYLSWLDFAFKTYRLGSAPAFSIEQSLQLPPNLAFKKAGQLIHNKATNLLHISYQNRKMTKSWQFSKLQSSSLVSVFAKGFLPYSLG